MEEEAIISGLKIYLFILLSITAVAYVYCIYYTIKEGRKRDVLNFGLIFLALFASPFITAGLVSLTKRVIDRINVSYLNKAGKLIRTRLSSWKKLKLGISSIQEVENINTYCRFCKTDFHAQESKCSNCGEKRKWYGVKLYNTSTKTNKLIAIPELINQKNDAVIVKQVYRNDTPLSIP